MTIATATDFPSIKKVLDQRKGLNFMEARALAASMGSRLARSAEFDVYFSKVPPGEPLTLSNNAWTETIAAYPKPKKPFGDSVEWTDDRTGIRYTIDTSAFKGQKQIAIAFEGCDIVQDGSTLVFVPLSQPSIIEPFPQECGFYAAGMLLPFDDGSERSPASPGTKHLTRDNNGEWVGPVVRSYSRIRTPDNLDNDIYLIFRPSLNLGVFVKG
jgi:hypothetical protein